MASMSDDEFIELLRARDDPTSAEAPPEFDRPAAESSFVELANHLNSVLGVEISSHVLEVSYDGKNTGVSGFGTWGDRFFDWI